MNSDDSGPVLFFKALFWICFLSYVETDGKDLDWNFKNLAQLSHSFNAIPAICRAPWHDLVDIVFITIQEYFAEGWRHYVMVISAQNWPKTAISSWQYSFFLMAIWYEHAPFIQTKKAFRFQIDPFRLAGVSVDGEIRYQKCYVYECEQNKLTNIFWYHYILIQKHNMEGKIIPLLWTLWLPLFLL